MLDAQRAGGTPRMLQRRFVLRLLMLVLMILGGRDRRCDSVHRATSIIRYRGDVERAEISTTCRFKLPRRVKFDQLTLDSATPTTCVARSEARAIGN